MRYLIVGVLLATFCSCDLVMQQKPSETQVVSPPMSQPARVNPSDSSYLRITINPKGYTISVLDKFKTTEHVDSLDSFIFSNQAFIDKKRIVVTSNDTSDLQRISQVLKKHGFTKVNVEFN